MMGRGSSGWLAALLFLASSSAIAEEIPSDIEINAPMVPFVYRYAACLFDETRGAVDPRIAGCAEVRRSIESDYEASEADWQRSNRPGARRKFHRALDLLEDEARIAARTREPVPQGTINYLDCVGSTLSERAEFIEGRVVDFPQVDRSCRDLRSERSSEAEQALERMLYARLRFRYRVINSIGKAPSYATFHYGLLAPRRR